MDEWLSRLDTNLIALQGAGLSFFRPSMVPDYTQGFGILDLAAALPLPGKSTFDLSTWDRQVKFERFKV